MLSWNTVGNLLGSLLGGAVFYCFLDCPRIFLVAVLLACISTSVAAWVAPMPYRMTSWAMLLIGIVLLVFVPFYDKSHFAIGAFRMRAPESFILHGVDRIFSSFVGQQQILSQTDGPPCTVAVIENTAPEEGEQSTS